MPTHLGPGASTKVPTNPWCCLCQLLSVWQTRKMTWSLPAILWTSKIFSQDVSHSRMQICPPCPLSWTLLLHSTLGAWARCSQMLRAKFKVGSATAQFRLEASTSAVSKDCPPSVNILTNDPQHKLAVSSVVLTNWVVWTCGAKRSLSTNLLLTTFKWSSSWSRDDNSRRCLLVRANLCWTTGLVVAWPSSAEVWTVPSIRLNTGPSAH